MIRSPFQDCLFAIKIPAQQFVVRQRARSCYRTALTVVADLTTAVQAKKERASARSPANEQTA
jgi:hypothetical protein